VCQEFLVLKVSQEHKDPRDHKVPLVFKVLKEHKAPIVFPEFLVHRE
jgi:hypothetical protein